MTDPMQDSPVSLSTGLRSGMIRQVERFKKLPPLVFVLIIGLVTPLSVNLGSLRLSVYRVILLLLFFPLLHALMSGKVGRIRFPDICVILICIWSLTSIIFFHGVAEHFERMGMMVLEILGAYLIGRVLVRSPEAFGTMIKLFFVLALLMLPFAVFEALTGRNIILDVFGKIGSTYTDVYKDPRWGLDRVQGPFAHPIHFGVFFGVLTGVTFYVLGYGKSVFGRLSRTVIVIVVGSLALSSGPLFALVTQVIFIAWDIIFRSVRLRWYVFGGLSVLGYVVVDMISNRNPFEVAISYLAFSEHTASNRIYIWEWGTKNMFDNPIFGIGFNEWERYDWMSPSFDMFWLISGMQHGVFVWLLYFAIFFSVFFKTAYAKITDPRLHAYRMGYLTTMFGFFMGGWTVHFWDATLVLIMFFLASGMWMTDEKVSLSQEEAPPPDEVRQGIRYSRFETSHWRA